MDETDQISLNDKIFAREGSLLPLDLVGFLNNFFND